MKLNLSSFSKAITHLERSVAVYHASHSDPELQIYLMAGSIQVFEYTYELSWKMLKRYLEMTESSGNEVDLMSFADLIRAGCEKGLLLSELVIWKKYREKRSITSHTYDYDKALAVFEQIPQFLQDAKYLLEKLQMRIAADDS
jgi:nucleotidyltransferase substrate binding protein (TIGR01987 family)